jgi:glycosyl transferase family 25
MNFSSLVITLKRSTTRVEQVRRIIATCPIPCESWDATDGSLLTDNEIANVYEPGLHFPRYPFELSRGEMGCFLSHRRIWQKMVDENIQRLVVLEDDVDFLPNFPKTLQFASENIPDDAYLQFQVREVQSTGSVKKQPPIQNCLVRPTLVPLRTSAQLVTLKAAQKLLGFSAKFDRPVDAAIQLKWIHGVKVLTSHPRSVVEVSSQIGGSTIGSTHKKKKPLIFLLRREIARGIYRAKIKYHSEKHAFTEQATSDRCDRTIETACSAGSHIQRDAA